MVNDEQKPLPKKSQKDQIEQDLASMGVDITLDEDMGGRNIKKEIDNYFLKEYGTKNPTKEQIQAKAHKRFGWGILKTIIDSFASLYLIVFSLITFVPFLIYLYRSLTESLPGIREILILSFLLALLTIHFKKKINNLDFGKSTWFSYFIVALLFWNLILLYFFPNEMLQDIIDGVFEFMHGENGFMGETILQLVMMLIIFMPSIFLDSLRIKQKSGAGRLILWLLTLIAFAIGIYVSYLGYTKDVMEQLNFIWTILVGGLFFLCVKVLFLERSNKIFEGFIGDFFSRSPSKSTRASRRKRRSSR